MQRPRTPQRGLTFAELLISLVLLAGLLLVVVQVVASLSSVGAASIDRNDADRRIAGAVDQLRDDLQRATVCDPTGQAGTLARVDDADGAAQLALFTDAAADGSPTLVVYDLRGGALQRYVAEADADDPCATSVDDAVDGAGEVILDGAYPPVDADAFSVDGDCDDVRDPGCAADHVDVRIAVDAGASGTVTLARTMPVPDLGAAP